MSVKQRISYVAVAAVVLAAGCGGTSNSTAGGNNNSNGGGSTPGAGSAPGPTAPPLPTCPVDAIKSVSAPVDVLVWYELSGVTETTLKSQVDKYNASQTKVKVKLEKQGADYDELLRAYERAMQAKTLPDLVILEDTTTQFMIDSDTVLPAQSCLDAEKMSKDGYLQTAVTHYSVGGALYPASASVSDILTYYNKNHFRRAGLDPEKPPTTLAEVRQMAEKIKAAGITDKPVVLKLDSWFIETALTGDKQPLVDNENGHGAGQTTKAVFDTPATQKLVAWVNDMNKDGLLNAVPATSGQVDHYLAMAGQKSSITLETSTSATSVKAFLGGDTSVGGVNAGDVDVTKLSFGAGPVFGVDGAGQAQVGGNAFYMLKTSSNEKQSASWDFMKWWNQVDQQVEWHLKGSYLPFVNQAAEDPRVQAFWKDDLAGQWLAIAYKEMKDGVHPDFTGPRVGAYDKLRVALRSALDRVVFKGEDPKAALTKASDESTAAITEYNAGSFGGG